MSQKRPDELALFAILEEVEAGRIRIYRNVLNQPWVFCDHPNHPSVNWQLYDRDFRGWLSNFIWERCRILPRGREIERILELLSGRSLKHHISTATDPALLEIIETEPVVAVVVEFMHGKDRHEYTMEGLWKALKKFAKERGLGSNGKRRFPGGPHVLSRKLRQFNEVFFQLGINIEIRRSNGSKVTLTGRTDCSASEASNQPSADKSPSGNALAAADGREARLAALKYRQRHQTSETESEN